MLLIGLHMTNLYKIIFLLSITSQTIALDNYIEAKKNVYGIFSGNKVTLYCSCTYDDSGAIDHKSCGMTPTKDIQRANKVEIEHIVPISHGIRNFRCGREKICKSSQGYYFRGRKCCKIQGDPQFQKFEGEMFNLWPSVGSINNARSDYRFAVLPSVAQKQFDGCNVIIDDKAQLFELPNKSKGIVARATLFMADNYNIKITDTERAMYHSWSTQFPPGEFEIMWASEIKKIQGYGNPYIENFKQELHINP